VDNLTDEAGPPRGKSTAVLREVHCKDCLRENRRTSSQGTVSTDDRDPSIFEYNETWAQDELDRGGSRTDRCVRHRSEHRRSIEGLAVAYIDITTIGTVENREEPSGPLGGLGPLPEVHVPVFKTVNLAERKFGMTDDHIRTMLEKLSNPNKRILILKAGTGTGKSTFAPFRLMSPPNDVTFRLADLGPIIVTEPRIQATTGVARFVGEKLVMGCVLKECSKHGPFDPDQHEGEHPGPQDDDCEVLDCDRHIGPGYEVGYQIQGDKYHDDACRLIYVTDGTITNWFKEGRLNKIGTVIVDEAHERSTNIDFILGSLKRDIDRYPHLRVIVTSATFDVEFYKDFFGADRVEIMDVPAVKDFGYGSPIFPRSTGESNSWPCGCEPEAFAHHGEISSQDDWIQAHWPTRLGPGANAGESGEDLHAITEKILSLRFGNEIPSDKWAQDMKDAVAEQVIRMVRFFDEEEIHGDVLAFLPNSGMISHAVDLIRAAVDPEKTDVFSLIQSESTANKEAALGSRPFGAKRKVVVSTNLAETSLTVIGVRFVVDSGLTTQGVWDTQLASKSVPTSPHSRAGLRQRWGRVGRDMPGWVFPLYTRPSFDDLAQDTPPGSTRENLESLVLKAKTSGVDDVGNFPWPAGHLFHGLDESAQEAMCDFRTELFRASASLAASGMLDEQGDPSEFGREIERFSGYSAGFAIAAILADQLACLPEVVSVLSFLDAEKPRGADLIDVGKLRLEDPCWPGEWQFGGDRRWTALTQGCKDELDLVLRIMSLWERADPNMKPWEDSDKRQEWSRTWFVRHESLLDAAKMRRTLLETFSPMMKDEVKRFLEPTLAHRTRVCISRAYRTFQWQESSGGGYLPLNVDGETPASPDGNQLATLSKLMAIESPPHRFAALTRGRHRRSGGAELRGLIEIIPWAADSKMDALRLIQRLSDDPRPAAYSDEPHNLVTEMMLKVPVGMRIRFGSAPDEGGQLDVSTAEVRAPFALPAQAIEGSGSDDESGGYDPRILEVGVTSSDQTGILDNWPTGLHQRFADDEELERLRLHLLEDDTVDPSTGMLLGQEMNGDGSDDLNAVDALSWWRERQEIMADLTNLNYVITGPKLGTGWFEVVGYSESESGRGVGVVLNETYDCSDRAPDLAIHEDLELTQNVTVVVRGELASGTTKWRVFERLDGKGRFLVARGDPPSSRPRSSNPIFALDRAHQKVLFEIREGSEMTALVAPTIYGTTAISFLPVLHDHLMNRASSQRIMVPQGSLSSRGMPGGERFWNAVVTSGPNKKGSVDIEILDQDRMLGISHRFGVHKSKLIAIAPGVEESTPLTGIPIKVSLRSSAQLQVPEWVAREFENREPAIRVISPNEKNNSYHLRTHEVLGLEALHELADYGHSSAWLGSVWDFFYDSHLCQAGNILPGSSTTIVHVPMNEIETLTDAALEALRENMTVAALVVSVRDHEVTIQLPGGAVVRSNPKNSPIDLNAGGPTLCRVHELDRTLNKVVVDLDAPIGVTMRLPERVYRIVTTERQHFGSSPGAAYWPAGDEGIVHARFRSLPDADKAIEKIEAFVAHWRYRFTLPQGKAGLVIGKDGKNIARIKSLTGVKTAHISKDGGHLEVAVHDETAIDRVTELLKTLVGNEMAAVQSTPASAAIEIVYDGRIRAREYQRDPFAAVAQIATVFEPDKEPSADDETEYGIEGFIGDLVEELPSAPSDADGYDTPNVRSEESGIVGVASASTEEAHGLLTEARIAYDFSARNNDANAAEGQPKRVRDVRDGCIVTDDGSDYFIVQDEVGRAVRVLAADYRRDARPLHWIRELSS